MAYNQFDEQYDFSPVIGYDFRQTLVSSCKYCIESVQRSRDNQRDFVVARTYLKIDNVSEEKAFREIKAYKEWLKKDESHKCPGRVPFCRHQYMEDVVRCRDIYLDRPKIDQQTIFLEYWNGGDIDELLALADREQGYVPEPFVWCLFGQMLQAVNRLHERNIIYTFGTEEKGQFVFNLLSPEEGYLPAVKLGNFRAATRPEMYAAAEDNRWRDLQVIAARIKRMITMPSIPGDPPQRPNKELLFWVRKCGGEGANFEFENHEWNYQASPKTGRGALPTMQEIRDKVLSQLNRFLDGTDYEHPEWMLNYFKEKWNWYQDCLKNDWTPVECGLAQRFSDAKNPQQATSNIVLKSTSIQLLDGAGDIKFTPMATSLSVMSLGQSTFPEPVCVLPEGGIAQASPIKTSVIAYSQSKEESLGTPKIKAESIEGTVKLGPVPARITKRTKRHKKSPSIEERAKKADIMEALLEQARSQDEHAVEGCIEGQIPNGNMNPSISRKSTVKNNGTMIRAKLPKKPNGLADSQLTDGPTKETDKDFIHRLEMVYGVDEREAFAPRWNSMPLTARIRATNTMVQWVEETVGEEKDTKKLRTWVSFLIQLKSRFNKMLKEQLNRLDKQLWPDGKNRYLPY